MKSVQLERHDWLSKCCPQPSHKQATNELCANLGDALQVSGTYYVLALILQAILLIYESTTVIIFHILGPISTKSPVIVCHYQFPFIVARSIQASVKGNGGEQSRR